MADDANTPDDKGAGKPASAAAIDLKKAMQEAATRPLSEEEIYFMLGRYPYLEICDASITDDTITGTSPLTLFRAQAGWTVFDDGNMLRTSQSELVGRLVYLQRTDESGKLLKPSPEEDVQKHADEDEEGGGAGGLLPPSGTIVGQFVNVAEELVLLAMERWPEGVRIMGGYYPMMRAAWITAKLRDYKVSGFEPTSEDQVVLQWTESLSPARKTRTVAPTKKSR